MHTNEQEKLTECCGASAYYDKGMDEITCYQCGQEKPKMVEQSKNNTMNKTAAEILSDYWDPTKRTPSNWNCILEAMEEYASQLQQPATFVKFGETNRQSGPTSANTVYQTAAPSPDVPATEQPKEQTAGEEWKEFRREKAIDLLEGGEPYISEYLSTKQVNIMCKYIDSYLDKVFSSPLRSQLQEAQEEIERLTDEMKRDKFKVASGFAAYVQIEKLHGFKGMDDATRSGIYDRYIQSLTKP